MSLTLMVPFDTLRFVPHPKYSSGDSDGVSGEFDVALVELAKEVDYNEFVHIHPVCLPDNSNNNNNNEEPSDSGLVDLTPVSTSNLTSPFTILEPQHQDISEIYVAMQWILKLQNFENEKTQIPDRSAATKFASFHVSEA